MFSHICTVSTPFAVARTFSCSCMLFPYGDHPMLTVGRLFMRGIDASGHVANMVETEQIVEYQGDRMSFVQVRVRRG